MDSVICSNCKKRVPKDEIICPECGLGLVPLEEDDLFAGTEEDDLFTGIEEEGDDDLFAGIEEEGDDDLFAGIEEEGDDLFADIKEDPDSLFADVEEETDDEIAEMLDINTTPTIPQFDDSMTVPQFDESTDQLGDMALPTFDDSTFTATTEVHEEIYEEEQKYQLLQQTSTMQWLVLMAKQWAYWIFIFIIISIAAIEVKDPNITLATLTAEQIYLGPDLYIFGWIVYFAMGWIVSYQLRKAWILPNFLAASIYLLGLFIATAIISILIPLFNVGTILTIYISMVSLGTISSFLTGGIFTFYLGYKTYFERIFEITPLSKTQNHIVKQN